MTDTTRLSDRLKAAAELALAQIDNADLRFDAQAGDLDQLIHDAEAREHRRAAHLLRDARCYRLGSAFEPAGGLLLDPVAVTGWLATGPAGVLLLAEQVLAKPDAGLAEHFATLFRSSAGGLIRAHGVWLRWAWLRDYYMQEVTDFLASPKGRDPKAGWRNKPPSNRQTYLVAEICVLLQLEFQSFATRGDAFEWILKHEGNPRFSQEPPQPDLRGLTGAFR